MNINSKSLYPISSNVRMLGNMQKQLDGLINQLGTGKRYGNLADMGSARLHALNLHARLGKVQGYQANAQTVQTRIDFHVNALERLSEIESETRRLAIPSAYGTDGVNMTVIEQQSRSLFNEVIDLLNTEINGQYIFAGNKSDTKPVPDFKDLMDATAPDGYRAVLDEYLQAHGADGTTTPGRLEIGPGAAPNTVDISSFSPAFDPDNPDVPRFGIFVSGAEASKPGVVQPNPDDEYTFTLDPDTVEVGDTITLKVSLPQDPHKEYTIRLTATDQNPPGLGQFYVDGTNTAASFEEALTKSMQVFADGELRAATVEQATNAFFTSDPDGGVPRVEFNGDDEPLSYDGTQDTLVWYNGQTSDVPRQSMMGQVDEATRVAFGVQGNEHGLAELMRGLSMMVVGDFKLAPDSNDPVVKAENEQKNAATIARYESIADKVRYRLSDAHNNMPGSIEVITMELALSSVTLKNVGERHAHFEAQLENLLFDVEEAPTEEVAMQILTLTTRMEASYQVTSMVNRLSLVNFLS